MPRQNSNLRILSHDERSEVEATITKQLGELLDDVGFVASEEGEETSFSYTWDPSKSLLIAEKYSANGNAIEFYEVRLVVGFVGNGNHNSEQI